MKMKTVRLARVFMSLCAFMWVGSAEAEAEDGTEAHPYTIASAHDLTEKLIAHANEGCYFVQTADIVLEVPFNGVGSRNMKEALGSDIDAFIAGAFRGNYDGGNHTVSGLILTTGDYIGFFNATYDATIKNLKISLGNATGWSDSASDQVGAVFVGTAVKTLISNCQTIVSGSCNTFRASKTAAGFVGYAGHDVVIEDCINNLNIESAGNQKAAGFIACVQAGQSSGAGVVINGCSTLGDVKGSGTWTAGMVGYLDSGMTVTFKGDNIISGTIEATAVNETVQSVIGVYFGSVALDGAKFSVPAAYKTVSDGKAVDGLYFATVDGGVATLVMNVSVVKGGSYKVMAAGAPAIVLADLGDQITVDTSLATATVTTDTVYYSVAQEGNVYTVVNAVKTGSVAIELWPLEWNSQLQRPSAKATNDRLNDFNVPKVGSCETGLNAPAGNWSAFYIQPSVDKNCLYNSNTARYLTPTNDFTLEGWVYLKSAPSDYFYVIAAAPNLGDGRWLFTLRPVNGTYQWQLYAQGKYGAAQSMGDRVLKTLSASEMNGCLNKWMHWALTYSHGAGTKGAAWHAYLDYEELGAGIQFDTVMTAANAPFTKDYVFSLGGRPNASNAIDGSIDYVRLSSSVLGVSELMTRTPAAEEDGSTVAHWPLTGPESGKIRTDSLVGDRGLSGCLHQSAWTKSTIRPSAEQAFTGNLNGLLNSDNRGSWRMTTPWDIAKISNLGRDLDVSNSFTIEGWVNLEFSGAPTTQYVFYTRDNGAQWSFQLAERFVESGRRWQFEIFAQDSKGATLHSAVTPYNLQGMPLSGDVSEWRGWKHVALVYNHQGYIKGTAEYGVWQMYADGVLQGAVTNVKATAGITANCQNFYLGGRFDKDTWNFSGLMDCFRVSKSALSPAEFLNGQNPNGAANVLALWPLDVDETGAYLDGRDVKGNYSIASNYAGLKATPAVVDGENVTRFYTSGNTKAALAVYDPAVTKMFKSAPAYTVECYLRRDEALNGWEVVLGTVNDSWNGMGLNFSYRSNGFVIYYGGNNGVAGCVNDVAFDSSRLLEIGKWTHMALVCRRSSTRIEFDLYLDGQKVGNTVSGNLPPSMEENFLMVGGRTWNPNSFRGEIKDLRLTARELAPSEFLCNDTHETRTAAFWTIDKTDDGKLDLLNHVDASHPMSAKGAVDVGRGARSYVPNPDTTIGYVGDPKVNKGGATLSSGGNLLAGGCGSLVDVGSCFTVEGWLRWNGAKGVQDICGTYTQETPAGWKLSIDNSGTSPILKITAGKYLADYVIDQAFDVDLSDWKDKWRHVALSYDPHAGYGTWSLSIDGKFADSVQNAKPLYGTGFGAEDFVLGETFVGGVDMWRISEGLLTTEGLLYRQPLGLSIIVR